MGNSWKLGSNSYGKKKRKKIVSATWKNVHKDRSVITVSTPWDKVCVWCGVSAGAASKRTRVTFPSSLFPKRSHMVKCLWVRRLCRNEAGSQTRLVTMTAHTHSMQMWKRGGALRKRKMMSCDNNDAVKRDRAVERGRKVCLAAATGGTTALIYSSSRLREAHIT